MPVGRARTTLPRMARRQGLPRLRHMVLAAATIGQLPGFALLGAWVGFLPSLIVCLLLTLPLLARVTHPGRLTDGLEGGFMGALLLAFYVWWGSSMLAGALYP